MLLNKTTVKTSPSRLVPYSYTSTWTLYSKPINRSTSLSLNIKATIIRFNKETCTGEVIGAEQNQYNYFDGWGVGTGKCRDWGGKLGSKYIYLCKVQNKR